MRSIEHKEDYEDDKNLIKLRKEEEDIETKRTVKEKKKEGKKQQQRVTYTKRNPNSDLNHDFGERHTDQINKFTIDCNYLRDFEMGIHTHTYTICDVFYTFIRFIVAPAHSEPNCKIKSNTHTHTSVQFMQKRKKTTHNEIKTKSQKKDVNGKIFISSSVAPLLSIRFS